MKVLLTDDDPLIREVLRVYLERENYEVLEAEDGETALFYAPEVQLIVLDIMLPRLSGWEVAKELRQAHPELPILMLTAHGSEDERVYGLELAEDYVVKPFSPRELVARIKVLLRRTGISDELRYGDLLIRTNLRKVSLNGRWLQLSKLEFDLLLLLAQHPGLVWSRDRLLERVWGTDFMGVDRVVDTRIAALRKKLSDDSVSPSVIETIKGVGYCFREI